MAIVSRYKQHLNFHEKTVTPEKQRLDKYKPGPIGSAFSRGPEIGVRQRLIVLSIISLARAPPLFRSFDPSNAFLQFLPLEIPPDFWTTNHSLRSRGHEFRFLPTLQFSFLDTLPFVKLEEFTSFSRKKEGEEPVFSSYSYEIESEIEWMNSHRHRIDESNGDIKERNLDWKRDLDFPLDTLRENSDSKISGGENRGGILFVAINPPRFPR